LRHSGGRRDDQAEPHKCSDEPIVSHWPCSLTTARSRIWQMTYPISLRSSRSLPKAAVIRGDPPHGPSARINPR
jgi:hypothetical protein